MADPHSGGSAMVKCPECEALGVASLVCAGTAATTLIGWWPYHDDAGRYHSHDPNRHARSYSCSKGHSWVVRGIDPCPCRDCDYGREGANRG